MGSGAGEGTGEGTGAPREYVAVAPSEVVRQSFMLLGFGVVSTERSTAIRP